MKYFLQKKLPAAVLLAVFVLAPCGFVFSQKVVTGVIKDSDGLPLPGSTVIVKGTGNGAVADVEGQFSLELGTGFPFTLQFSSVGFDPLEIRLNELPAVSLDVVLKANLFLSEVVVTARRRQESAQNIPIPISVVSGARAEDAGAFNVNRLKELLPSVQLYSSNPRNTALNIRGLGTTFGLTNDGIDPGVGFYVDGVYFARPAAAALDFMEVERIEVLRGPQGTLFGKNTTAGAFSITTRKPGFTPGGSFELSYGNYGFIQARATLTGPLSNRLAARLSFSGTQRDGVLYNTVREEPVNDLNNLGLRGQLLFTPSGKVDVTLAGDFSRQRPNGYAQVLAGVVATQRPAFRQFEQIIADLDYEPVSRNPFDRKIDHDTPWRSSQDFGGASLNVDVKAGRGTLTATSAYRYWKWGPSNDRDFTGLQSLALSQAPSIHHSWSQEIRYAGNFASRLSGVFGFFAFYQKLDPDGAHTEESGIHQWRFSQNNTDTLWQTPGLLDGYGVKTYPRFTNFSGALYGQVDWAITEKLHLHPGIRFNRDQKTVDFRRETYGGLQTNDPKLISLKERVYSNQAFRADISDFNLSGQLTLACQANHSVNAFATFSTSFKPVGLNLGGLPRENGENLIGLAVIKPEEVRHFEVGVKTAPSASSVLNLTIFHTGIKNFQTLVQTPDLSVNRGYLANAEKVRVRGAELEGRFRAGQFLLLNGAIAYTDGRYVTFTNAPPPLEETGGPTFKDVSGGRLPGISKWAGSLGAELAGDGKFLAQAGEYFFAADSYFRSAFSSSPSPSRYLNISGYALLNVRLGFRERNGLTVFLWVRNLLNRDYFEQLLPGGGGVGHYAAVLGDPATVGVTMRYVF
jgi:iron complex outermembrane recepter protein